MKTLKLPPIRTRLIAWLLQKPFIQRRLNENVSLKDIPFPPPKEIPIGLALIALSFTIGWPGVGVFGITSLLSGNVYWLLIGGPLIYGLSWIVWGIGMAFVGPESIREGNIVLRWLIKKGLLRLLAQNPNQFSSSEINSASMSDRVSDEKPPL